MIDNRRIKELYDANIRLLRLNREYRVKIVSLSRRVKDLEDQMKGMMIEREVDGKGKLIDWVMDKFSFWR